MTSELELATAPPSAPALGLRGVARRWLVSPWFDVLFIANAAWPLLLLVQSGEGFAGRSGIQFWQIYYLTTPHRWITLLLVFLDGGRFRQRRGTFLGLALGVAAICLGVRITTGALTCLLAIDYVWNAWHFAAQHHGIYRIYSRLDGSASRAGVAIEKWSMRLFLLYVTLRIATATWADADLESLLRATDWIALPIPVLLVAWSLRQSSRGVLGGLVYLVSVCTLYTLVLWSVHERWLGLVLCLATASALFHATEYLALVSWSVRRRYAAVGNGMGVLAHLAPRWGLALGVFVLILGAGAWLMDQWFVDAWLLLNVIVAFLHYAYDGLIWRAQPIT